MRSTVPGGASAGVPSPSNDPAFRPAGPGEAPAAPGAEPPHDFDRLEQRVARAYALNAGLRSEAGSSSDWGRRFLAIANELEEAHKIADRLASALNAPADPAREAIVHAVRVMRINIREATGMKAVIVKAYLGPVSAAHLRAASYRECRAIVDEIANMLATLERGS